MKTKFVFHSSGHVAKAQFFPFIFCSHFSQFSSCLFSVSGDALDENHLHTG